MQNKKFPPILRTLFLIVVSLVLGINIYSWNAKSLTGNVLPMPFGYGGAVVLSGSMEPTIAVDELIIVKAEDGYEVGDIVVYQAGRILVVHRIVALDGETVTNMEISQRKQIAKIVRFLKAHIPPLKDIQLVATAPTSD